jgi:NAD(P)-dependent dehydrogenase (short-subunit alcohol dehydrogenase family)
MAEKGWKVVIADRNAEESEKTAHLTGGDFIVLDVRSWSEQYAAFEKTFKKYGRIDFGEWLAQSPGQ